LHAYIEQVYSLRLRPRRGWREGASPPGSPPPPPPPRWPPPVSRLRLLCAVLLVDLGDLHPIEHVHVQHVQLYMLTNDICLTKTPDDLPAAPGRRRRILRWPPGCGVPPDARAVPRRAQGRARLGLTPASCAQTESKCKLADEPLLVEWVDPQYDVSRCSHSRRHRRAAGDTSSTKRKSECIPLCVLSYRCQSRHPDKGMALREQLPHRWPRLGSQKFTVITRQSVAGSDAHGLGMGCPASSCRSAGQASARQRFARNCAPAAAATSATAPAARSASAALPSCGQQRRSWTRDEHKFDRGWAEGGQKAWHPPHILSASPDYPAGIYTDSGQILG